MHIRVAKVSDAKAIQEIYAPYVEKTNITFEYDVPSVEEMTHRIKKTLEKFPYLVAIEQNQIIGYAYASVYRTRHAYKWDSELSIYIDEHYHGQSVGKILYEKLIDILKAMHIQNVYACITYPNEKSEKFHQKFGFELIGCFHQVGYKFDTWHDVIWMEKAIGKRDNVQEVIPFSLLSSIFFDSSL